MSSEHILIKELLALIWMDKFGIIGRYRLTNVLNLTEGVTRGLLKRLSNKNLIKTEGKEGYTITPEGQKKIEDILKKHKIMDINDFNVGTVKSSDQNIIIHLRNFAAHISNGIEQRDAAIRAGADGATTIIYKENNLFIPFNNQTMERLPQELSNKFKEQFKLKDDDIVIVGFAKEKARALEGALAASILTYKTPVSRIGFKEKESVIDVEYAKLTKEQLKEIQKLEKKHKMKLLAYK